MRAILIAALCAGLMLACMIAIVEVTKARKTTEAATIAEKTKATHERLKAEQEARHPIVPTETAYVSTFPSPTPEPTPDTRCHYIDQRYAEEYREKRLRDLRVLITRFNFVQDEMDKLFDLHRRNITPSNQNVRNLSRQFFGYTKPSSTHYKGLKQWSRDVLKSGVNNRPKNPMPMIEEFRFLMEWGMADAIWGLPILTIELPNGTLKPRDFMEDRLRDYGYKRTEINLIRVRSKFNEAKDYLKQAIRTFDADPPCGVEPFGLVDRLRK